MKGKTKQYFLVLNRTYHVVYILGNVSMFNITGLAEAVQKTDLWLS